MDSFAKYNDYLTQAKEFFESNFEKIKAFFDNKTLQNFILEPFRDIITANTPKIDKHIYQIITQTALINAVIAAVPGKMGIGVFVCIAFEAYMAYQIAKYVGVDIKKPSDIFDHFGVIGGGLIGVSWGFKTLLSFVYSLLSFIPLINPFIIAEFLTTNFIGVIFWVGFQEAKGGKLFRVPTFAIYQLVEKTKTIFLYQFNGIKTALTPENIKSAAYRFKAWFSGEIARDVKVYNGEIFCAAAMIYLINGQTEKLQGELGERFLEAIRLRWSAQLPPDAGIDEISALFAQYDQESLAGAVNTIKGKMFELLIVDSENSDNDHITARLFTDESHPNTDITFIDSYTDKCVDISLKATDNPHYIESALCKYPDTPIMTTEEVSQYFGDNPLIIPSEISNEYLEKITHDNMDKLLQDISPINAAQVAIAGGTVSVAFALWPYTIAYFRKRISFSDYQKAIAKICPALGEQFASRVAYALIFGPIFAWYLIARSVFVAAR
jgi:hypothetical protein